MSVGLQLAKRMLIIEGVIFGGVALASIVMGFGGFHGWSNALFIVGGPVSAIAAMSFAGSSNSGVVRRASGRFAGGSPMLRDAYMQSMSTEPGGITGGMAEAMRQDKDSGGFDLGYPAAFAGAGVIAIVIAAIFSSS